MHFSCALRCVVAVTKWYISRRRSKSYVPDCRSPPGRAVRRGFDYFSRGTLSLYAALNVKNRLCGRKATACYPSEDLIGPSHFLLLA
jgi:hypothetical protein